MKKLLLFLPLISIFILSSCDEYNYVYYIVDNQSKDSIQIDYSYYNYYSNVESGSNSLIISGNKEDTLFTFELISPSVYNKEDEDKLIYLFDINIERIINNNALTKDALLRSNWEFNKIEDNFANFKLSITNEDF